MNNFQHDLISLLVNQKKYDAITEFCHSAYPDEKDVVVSEYCGADIRLFTGSDGSINILCPKEMSTIQESAVTKAIENGTIFDDAESVDNTAKYLELTSLPYNAIINNGKEIPKHMHVAIGGVIGNMNDEGRCEVDDASLRNGYQCMRDMMDADTSDEQSVNKIVDNYLGNPDHMSLHKKLRYDIGNLHDEIESIKDINPEDCITDEDCCESFDEYDMDEIETESYVYDEDGNPYIIYECDASDIEMIMEANEASKKLRRDSRDFINDAYTPAEIKKMSAKQRNRVKKFLKDNDYDPKTQTIKTDIIDDKTGKNVRIKFNTKFKGDQADEIKMMGDNPNDPMAYTSFRSSGEDEDAITIGKSFLKRKPVVSNGILKHEEGHVDYRDYHPDKYKRDTRHAKKLIKQTKEPIHEHGQNPEEYVVDLYGERHNKYAKKYPNKTLRALLSKDVATFKRNRDTLKKYADQIKKNLDDMDADEVYNIIDEIIEEQESAIDMYKDIPDAQSQVEIMKKSSSELKQFKEKLSKIDKSATKGEYTKFQINQVATMLNDVIKSIDNEVRLRMRFINKNIVREYATEEYDIPENADVYQEGFLSKKPKKLKPIPRDIVPYITVEMNAIRDSNDQAMLSGYTCSKLELVDFYLNVIDTNDERYIVPHTRQYLVQLQNDLNRLLTQILRIKPINKSDRVWQVNVNYPENWRG